MNSLTLELELLTPVSVTRRSATVGGHETLTWIPGGQLLGAVAAAIGSPVDELLWRLLFSGEVRFGDAWPAVDGRPAYVSPLSFHQPKLGGDGSWTNLAVAERTPGKQFQQVRDLHLTSDGEKVEVSRHHTLRTAVSDEGRAREGFLFGIDALDAGQRFVARIDADDPSLLERVAGLLVDHEISVGRSRSAELGRVRIRRVEGPADAPVVVATGAEKLVVWLVSDLALRDGATGMPRLQLTREDLGLPERWVVDERRSFVRTRRYSPWNGKRRRPDLERQLLQPGSVFVLSGPALDADAAARVTARIRRGLGEHLPEGLGRVLIDPVLLSGSTFTSTAPTPVSTPNAALPNDALGTWLGSRHRDRAREEHSEAIARALATTPALQGVRRSQWGEIRRMAREARFVTTTDRAGPSEHLREQVTAFLGHGARVHTWPAEAREALVEMVAAHPPEVVERASTRLAQRQKQPKEAR